MLVNTITGILGNVAEYCKSSINSRHPVATPDHLLTAEIEG
jgi:hypothetical protein